MSSVQKAPSLTQIMQYMDSREELQDLFAFNETFQSVQFRRDFEGTKAGSVLRDDHVIDIRWHLTRHENAHINKPELEDAIYLQGKKHRVNPVKDYLESLVWDGTSRLDTWLPVFVGCENNIYTREAGKVVLTAAVARIYDPGVKFDNLLVIEGDQGTGKSRLVESIGGAWFLDMAVKESDKDIVDEMRGAWIIEISELAGFSKKEVDWLKAFLSRRTDRCRLSYGRRSQDFPRQSIFIGTMNPSGDNTYLKDDTGNRRFLPITAGKIDVDGMIKARDQIFAEAVRIFKDGKQRLFLQGQALEYAEQEQSSRAMHDPWTHLIRRQLPMHKELTMGEILDIIGLHSSHHGHMEAIRAGRMMKKLGWIRMQKPSGERYYIRKEEYNGSNNQEAPQGAGQVGSEGRQERIGQENSGSNGESAQGEIFTLAEEMPDFNE